MIVVVMVVIDHDDVMMGMPVMVMIDHDDMVRHGGDRREGDG